MSFHLFCDSSFPRFVTIVTSVMVQFKWKKKKEKKGFADGLPVFYLIALIYSKSSLSCCLCEQGCQKWLITLISWPSNLELVKKALVATLSDAQRHSDKS